MSAQKVTWHLFCSYLFIYSFIYLDNTFKTATPTHPQVVYSMYKLEDGYIFDKELLFIYYTLSFKGKSQHLVNLQNSKDQRLQMYR